MKDDSSQQNQADTVEHLKFEIAQECGLSQKTNQKNKKNIKNS